MELYLSIFIYILLFCSFSLSIFGYGYYLKKIIINENVRSIGECGLFGFLALYIISVIFHFFINLNIYLSLSILSIGILLSIINIRSSALIKSYSSKSIITILLLFLLLGASNNPHDDVYLYQLPYISYLQNEKLVFGLVNINEFTAYSNSFYDIMALFNIPVLNNQSIFLLPTIFIMFFCILLIENFNKCTKILKIFIYSIFILALLKFTRSKEYGTDIPVTALIFLIQFYILKFFENKDLNLINKIIIFSVFAIFLKAYAVLVFLYLLVFWRNIKIFFKSNHNYINSFFLIFAIILISSFKNIAHSGCVSYPIKISCFDKKIISWANGHEVVELRNKGLVAGSKGIKPYIRNIERSDTIISASEYLEKFKYTYHLNVIKDPDFERLLVVVFIIFIFVLMSTVNKFKKNEFIEGSTTSFNLTFFNTIIFIIPTILWWIIVPISKYGGYAYLLFGIFTICAYSKLLNNISFKHLRVLSSVCIIYFIGKNIDRINNEYNSSIYSNQNYPLPKYIYQDFKIEKIDNKDFYVTDNLKRCGDIKFPCLERPHFEAIKSVKKLNGYLFFEGIKEKQIESIKIEQNWAYNTNNY